ncbi:MAG: type II toxin-antitoxin system RelE/ParE family toxin [Gammaproteobacteria bacterium]
MVWRIELTDTAERALKKLDPNSRQRIVGFLKERVAESANPRAQGKALQGELHSYWRYRVGPYRLICRIEDEAIRILVVRVGHRRDIYR